MWLKLSYFETRCRAQASQLSGDHGRTETIHHHLTRGEEKQPSASAYLLEFFLHAVLCVTLHGLLYTATMCESSWPAVHSEDCAWSLWPTVHSEDCTWSSWPAVHSENSAWICTRQGVRGHSDIMHTAVPPEPRYAKRNIEMDSCCNHQNVCSSLQELFMNNNAEFVLPEMN